MQLKGKVLSIVESSYQDKMAKEKNLDAKGFSVLTKVLEINEIDFEPQDLVFEIGVCAYSYQMMDLFAWIPREGRPVEKASNLLLATPVWIANGVARKVEISSGDEVELSFTRWYDKYSKPREENDNKPVRMVTSKGSKFISVKRPLFLRSSGTPQTPENSSSSESLEEKVETTEYCLN